MPMAWAQMTVEPVRLLACQLWEAIPKIVGAFLLLVVGWAAASVCRRVLIRVLRAIGVERLAEKAQLSAVLRRGEVRLTSVELLGQVGYCLVWLATIIVVLRGLGMTAADDWLAGFNTFIPRLIVSFAVFLFGMLLASFLGATVRAMTLNAGLPQGHMLGQVVYTSVLVVTILVALEQLHIVTRTLEMALYLLLGTCGLTVALAFGLGSQDLVKRFLEERVGGRWKPPKEPQA
ncbi:MAG: hypothetical protein HYZ89_04450 [Candidatus Omnitrophica bacterium]|nr:hypothetical protein [Candidatus Omnitrophota bacterium]